MSIELSSWLLWLLEPNLPWPWKQRNCVCALSKSWIFWKTTFTYRLRRLVYIYFSLIDISCLGSVERNLDFEFETENQVYYSCIATLFGNFYVLGGSSQNGRQVFKAKNLSKIIFNLDESSWRLQTQEHWRITFQWSVQNVIKLILYDAYNMNHAIFERLKFSTWLMCKLPLPRRKIIDVLWPKQE